MSFQKDIAFLQNGVNCDIYIGSGCGQVIAEDIEQATESIKIISPYITPALFESLLRKQENNVEVKLLTSYDCFNEANLIRNIPNIYSFLTETVLVNTINNRNFKLLDSLKTFIYILTSIMGVYLIVNHAPEIKWPTSKEASVFTALVVFGQICRIKTAGLKKEIYWHDKYTRAFPIRFVHADDAPFIHAKVFIIDNIVYVGSVNFTYAGFNKNIETRVKIDDSHTVEEFRKIFDDLYDSTPESFPHDNGLYMQRIYTLMDEEG